MCIENVAKMLTKCLMSVRNRGRKLQGRSQNEAVVHSSISLTYANNDY